MEIIVGKKETHELDFLGDKYHTFDSTLAGPLIPFFPNYAGYISLMIAFWTVLSGPMGDPFGNARLPVSLALFVFMLCVIRLFYWCCFNSTIFCESA